MTNRYEIDTVKVEKSERSHRRDNIAFGVLDAAMGHYNNLRAVRDEGIRCHMFINGDQWGDKIKYKKKMVTERAALIDQGYNPRTTNLLGRVVNNVQGVVLKNGNEPTAYSVDGNEQGVCDVINTLLKSNNTQNETKILWPQQFKQFMEWAVLVSKMTFGYRDGKFGCWTENIDPRNFFCDTGMTDIRGWDCNMVGCLHTLSIQDVCASFAYDKNPKVARAKHKEIVEQYRNCSDRPWVSSQYTDMFGKSHRLDVDFLFPKNSNMCRLIEVWTKESRPVYYVHDWMNGTLDVINEDEYDDYVEAENATRITMALQAGVPQEDIDLALRCCNGEEGVTMPNSCRLRTAEFHEERYWYYRFMTPSGYVIEEGESPYLHKEHPFVFLLHPMVNGEVRSPISNLLEEQKNLNRNRTMWDQIMRISMKGFTAYDKNTLPDDDPDGERLMDVLAQPGGSYGFNLKPGEQIQQKVIQMSSNNTGVGIMEMIQMDATNIEDISGVNGALQGKPGYSTTSGSLYAQQTQNATSSLLDVIEAYNGFLIKCAYKQASNMLQSYDEGMVTKIAGEGAWDTLQTYMATINGDRLQLDFAMVEGEASAVYRQVVWNYAQTWLQMGLIDFQTYLRICRLPVTDKLIVMLEEKNQQLMAQGRSALPDSVPQQSVAGSIAGASAPEAGANNAYNRMAESKPLS